MSACENCWFCLRRRNSRRYVISASSDLLSCSSEASRLYIQQGSQGFPKPNEHMPDPRFNLNVGCGAPVSPSSLVPQTPVSPSCFVPRPSSYNLDDTMFVAGVRRNYQDEFYQAVAEVMRVYAGQTSRIEAAWPSSSTVVPGSSNAPFVVDEDLLD